MPDYAPHLFKLAYIAVGDPDSAAVLAADVIALQSDAHVYDEAAALQLLMKLLPEGWLSWPGAAGPGEWLRLGLRREEADRLLSVLGEWDVPARVALGLWLSAGVRRDDLDGWLGTQGMADRVSEFVGYIGEGLDLIPPLGERPACADVAADLLDAHEPQVGRMVRLHTLGCEACRKRVDGLQATVGLLRVALNTFFRAPMPSDLARLVLLRQRQMRQPPVAVWKPLVIAAVLLLLFVGVVRKPAATAAPAPPPSNAAQLLDRALNRFVNGAQNPGVLHERMRMFSSQGNFAIERWHDYSGARRFRVTVQQDDNPLPLLDVTSDGYQLIAYEVNAGESQTQRVLVRNPDMQKLMPLVRQLPAVGSFGAALVPQQYLDLNLLASARRGQPMLLGTTHWQGRTAYTVVSTSDTGERLILTLDQETLSLVEGRIAATVGSGGSARSVWQAEVIEVLGRRDVPPTVFQLQTQQVAAAMPNPRQIANTATPTIDLAAAIRSSIVAVPESLPEQSMLAYIRDSSLVRTSTMQFYEGQWSTLAVEAPRFAEPLRRRPLEQSFAHGKYTEVEHNVNQTTILVFAMDRAPERRMRLYLWHALLDDAERTALSRSILDSLVLVDAQNVEQFHRRFMDLTVSDASAEAQLLGSLPVRTRSINPRRRFGRLKADQALARFEGVPVADHSLLP